MSHNPNFGKPNYKGEDKESFTKVSNLSNKFNKGPLTNLIGTFISNTIIICLNNSVI